MTTISIVPTKISRGSHKWVWANMGDDDVGEALGPDGGGIAFADKTVMIVAAAYDSATIAIQGSNDGSNWFTLTNPNNDSLSFTVGDQLDTILENPLYIRPKTSGGQANPADITVTLVGRATLQLR